MIASRRVNKMPNRQKSLHDICSALRNTVHQSNQNNECIVSTEYYSFYGKYSFSGRQQQQPICASKLKEE